MSDINVRNWGQKLRSEIKVRIQGEKSRSEIEVRNCGQKFGSEIWVRNWAHILVGHIYLWGIYILVRVRSYDYIFGQFF